MQKVTYPIVLKLQAPIEHGSETIYELLFKRPRVKHFKRMRMDNPGMDDAVEIISQLTGHPPSVIDELVMEDMDAASEILGNLFPASRKTTKQR